MKRVKELDGIRGIAIILVLIWHYIVSQAHPEKDSLSSILLSPLSLAWSGVDLFFVLSGFLIVGILLDVKESESYFKTFYIRRICRIFPLYYMMIILFILISSSGRIKTDWLFAGEIPLLSYLTFTQNFFMQFKGFGNNWLGVTWSLAIEEQFYLIVPVLVWFFKRKPLLFIFLCAICLAPIFRIILGIPGAYVLPFARADSILIGGAAAIIIRDSRIYALMIQNKKYASGAFIVFLIGAAVLTLKHNNFVDIFNHLWLGATFCLFIIIAILNKGTYINHFLSNKILAWFGLRSYGIYLLHQPVSGLAHFYFNGFSTPHFNGFSDFSITALSFVVVLILAELSYRYFEMIFLRYGKRYSYIQEKTGT
jgi:peptidoglycan/LPS O-acetylase OafA/YrhL